MKEGRLVSNYFTREGLIYQEAKEGDDSAMSESIRKGDKKKAEPRDGPIKINLLIPKKTNLKHRLKTEDPMFIDFCAGLLQIDPEKRMGAKEALKHPFLTEAVYPEDDN